MGRNVEKIKNMLNGIIDPSNKHIRVGWIPGDKEKNIKNVIRHDISDDPLAPVFKTVQVVLNPKILLQAAQ